jgi:ATP-dependent exoDNAse (exonuclease V) beta subunit
VYRLADLARSFEISHATSFRSFVDYLDDESVSGEAAEATIIEQDLPGVKLMTVHKAKGLEFPVVILADLTCKLCGAEDRWVDAERRVCAQRLLGCAPWELIEHREEQNRADREEAWRIAYVAATRARDLLVVCANGDEEPQESWLTPLYPALYPPEGHWRAAAAGGSTVLNRPFGEDTSVTPGLHHARAGGVPVTWFDPSVLKLAEREPAGLFNEELLKGSPGAGTERYAAWRRRRDERIAAGSVPMCNVIAATELAGPAEGEVLVVRTLRPANRAGGRSFGKLVHSVLQRARPGATRGELEALASAYARRFHVRDDEIGWAADAAAEALAHPLMAEAARAVRCHREYPVLMRLDGSTLVEGQVDLAFFDGARWTVVDFKTGPGDEARYRRQLSLYASAISQATGQPARAVVIEV